MSHDPPVRTGSRATDGRLALPSQQDPVVAALSGVIGGPPGRHAQLGQRRFWMPIRVLVLIAVVTLSLGWFNKSLCTTHGYTHEYQYTRLCYTDVFALWYSEGLDTGKVPYLDNITPTPGPDGVVHHKYVEYPVVIGGVMAAAEGLTQGLVSDTPTGAQQRAIDKGAAAGATDIDKLAAAQASTAYQTRQARVFFNITCVFLLLFGVAVVVLTGLTAGKRRIWDAALVGLAPALLLHADVNWDLVAVAFTAGALFAWSRRAPAVAGVLLGCGVATKFYPVVLLVPLLFLCLRAGQLRAWGRLTVAAAVTWLVVDLPVWIASPAGFGQFYAFSRDRGTEQNSLFYAFQKAFFDGQPWDPGQQTPFWLNFWGTAFLATLLVGIILVIMAAPRRPRLGQVAFLTVFAFMLTNKVYSPQYVLWILPLVALARPKWRYWLIWQLTEVVLLILLYGNLIYLDKSGAKGIPYGWFFFVGDLPRDLVLLGLCGLVIREIWRPDLDVVRMDGDDDPAGGVLDGAVDVLVVSMGAALDRDQEQGDAGYPDEDLVGVGGRTDCRPRPFRPRVSRAPATRHSASPRATSRHTAMAAGSP